MKRAIFIVMVFIVSNATSQIVTSTRIVPNDITTTFKGLTEDYQTYFKAKINSLVETMNKLSGIDNSITPIKLNITYENNEGLIQMVVHYNNAVQILKVPDMLKSQIKMAKAGGSNVFSIFLPDLLMLCLNDYKERVIASSKFSSEISKFKIKVKLEKSDGSWIEFNCKEYVDYNGIPRYSFGDNAEIKYLNNKVCKIVAQNSLKLDDYKGWELGESKKPDGTSTCDEYAVKFFEIKE